MSAKIKNTALYFAFAYATVLLCAAYYYVQPNKNADERLESMVINTLQKSDTAIDEMNDYAMQTMAYYVKANPRFASLLTPMTHLRETAKNGRAILAGIESESKQNSLTQTQADSALQALKILYSVQEQAVYENKRDWNDVKKKVPDINSFKVFAHHKTFYLQALRNALTAAEYIFLHYYSESFCSRLEYQPARYAIASQLQNTCVKEGEQVKGWFGFIDAVNMRGIDTITINGKPFPTVKSIATYKAKPQAAGNYPLVVTSKFMVHDTLIHVRDTLYYTVR